MEEKKDYIVLYTKKRNIREEKKRNKTQNDI